jgi:hypothetical protein
VRVTDDRWADELVRFAALGLPATAIDRLVPWCGEDRPPTTEALRVLDDRYRTAFEGLPLQVDNRRTTAACDPAFLLGHPVSRRDSHLWADHVLTHEVDRMVVAASASLLALEPDQTRVIAAVGGQLDLLVPSAGADEWASVTEVTVSHRLRQYAASFEPFPSLARGLLGVEVEVRDHLD